MRPNWHTTSATSIAAGDPGADRPLFTGRRPSTVEGAAAGDGAPRMSCSTDDHRANSLAERVGGTKRQRKNRQTRAVRLLIDYWGRAEGVKHAPEEERDATSEPDAERAFEGAVDSGKAARVVSSFFPIDVTRRPPLTLLAPDRR